EEEQVVPLLHLALLRRRRGGTQGKQESTEDSGQQPVHPEPGSPPWQAPGVELFSTGPRHDTTSLITLATGSTRRMGRPTLDGFCLRESTPRAWHSVASRSWTLTGRSLTSMPSSEVLPTTWPPLMPPPASTVDHALAQASRP